MNRLSSLLLSVVVAVGLLFAGCDSTGSGSESGTLHLTMDDASTSKTAIQTNAPVAASDIDEALVTIDEIAIVPAEDTSEGNSTDAGVTVLSDSNVTIDLKRLQAGIDTSLSDIEIPAGDYSQLRLVTADEASITFEGDSTATDVMIASGQQTGLKVNFDPFTVENEDDLVELTVNWNVEESLKGTSQNYVITPVVDATVRVTSAGN